MLIRRRALLAGAAALSAPALIRSVRAQAPGTIRIGVLTDLSGPYRDVGGPTSVACARQAAEEFTAANPGIKVEVVAADHQNKPDVGSAIVREWFDRGEVDLVTDINNSALAIALRSLAEEHDKIELVTSAGSSDLTGKYCSSNLLHWSWDSWCLAHSTGTALVKAGGDKWFFVTPDYAFGHAMQDDTAKFVQQAGGKVVGSIAYPFPSTTDFSSFLLQAQSSGANVVAFTSSGTDLANCIKQANEFGLTQGGDIRLAAMIGYITDVRTLGLQAAQGLVMTETFYWDLNDRTRAFMARIRPKLGADVFPNMSHVGNYSGVLDYLKAAKQLGVAQAKASGKAVLEVMRSRPADDDCFGASTIRADGRVIHPAYLFQVKTPAESRSPGDVYKLIATTPADQAFRPLSDGACPLVRS
jgi:branched-chain amino acid transport system substrate-binding protein